MYLPSFLKLDGLAFGRVIRMETSVVNIRERRVEVMYRQGIKCDQSWTVS